MKTLLSKTLGLWALLLAYPAWALVPLEGLLMGRVEGDLQQDPLSRVFRPHEASHGAPDAAQWRLYRAELEEAQALKASCTEVGEATFLDTHSQEGARRSVVATLQYVGLDAVVKALGSYARTLQVSPEEFNRLADNLVAGSCSPNLSVYGVKLVRQNLQAAYEGAPVPLPTMPSVPFAPEALRTKTDSRAAKENEFHHTAKLFRALCSWGGDVSNYRLLPPLLASPQVMAVVFRHLEGQQLVFRAASGAVEREQSGASVQVLCQDLICRRVPNETFQRGFPRYLGSSGLPQDLRRHWCGHFRYQDYLTGEGQHPQVRAWLKQQNPEDERKDVAQMLALFTGVPDLVIAQAKYAGLAQDLRLPMQERWDRWAQQGLGVFSRDLLYEEPLEVRVRPRRDPLVLRQELFGFDLDVTLGELDQVFGGNDKISAQLRLKLPRNWLRWVREEWLRTGDRESQERFTAEVAQRLRPMLDAKRALFPGPMLRGGVEHLLARELVEQLYSYQGPYFDQFKEEMLEVPVRFHYGVFALSYVRHKTVLEGGKQLDF